MDDIYDILWEWKKRRGGQLMLAALVRVKRFSYRRSVREC
jgi:hypothetical protein